MFNCDEFEVKKINKSDLSESELQLAEKTPIVTIGDKKNFYVVCVNSRLVGKVSNNTQHPLKEARLTGCNFLIREYGYHPEDHVFKSICIVTYERTPEPQNSYFKVKKK